MRLLRNCALNADSVFNGLAISLIFGIPVSTVLTLVEIPLPYFMAYRNRLGALGAPVLPVVPKAHGNCICVDTCQAAKQFCGPPCTYSNTLRKSPVKINVGTFDRFLRIGAGAALIGLAVAGWIGPWGYVGIIPVLTGLFRTCPMYTLLGLSTCPNATR